jgi:hypothetical protein
VPHGDDTVAVIRSRYGRGDGDIVCATSFVRQPATVVASHRRSRARHHAQGCFLFFSSPLSTTDVALPWRSRRLSSSHRAGEECSPFAADVALT